jgi:hypothetical protein
MQVVLPTGTAATDKTVEAMAAVSSTDVWAVGQSEVSSATGNDVGRMFADHWNGSAWTTIPVVHAGAAAEPGFAENLTGAYAASSSDVWAVGSYPPAAPTFNGGPSPESTLIEHWNGSAWSIVPAPDLSPSDGFAGVSGRGANDIWAVGSATYAIGQYVAVTTPLAEHWNGNAWSIVKVPTPGTDPGNTAAAQAAANQPDGVESAQFSAVAAVSPSDVWAVGSLSHPEGQSVPDRTFAEHWDGSSWQVVSVPDVTVQEMNAGAEDDLYAASAQSTTDVWAVGGADPLGTLAVHWDGTKWSLVPSPQTGVRGGLNVVTALEADDVWAAGDEIDHWDGHSWMQIATINGTGVDDTHAIAAVSANDLWFATARQFVHYVCS